MVECSFKAYTIGNFVILNYLYLMLNTKSIVAQMMKMITKILMEKLAT